MRKRGLGLARLDVVMAAAAIRPEWAAMTHALGPNWCLIAAADQMICVAVGGTDAETQFDDEL